MRPIRRSPSALLKLPYNGYFRGSRRPFSLSTSSNAKCSKSSINSGSVIFKFIICSPSGFSDFHSQCNQGIMSRKGDRGGYYPQKQIVFRLHYLRLNRGKADALFTLKGVALCLYFYMLFTQFSSSLSETPFSILPFIQFALGQRGLSTSTVLPIPLPPEVAKGIIVLPEKS